LKPKQQSPLAFREKDGHPSKAGEEMVVAFREKMDIRSKQSMCMERR
jgi:hypothetical protein